MCVCARVYSGSCVACVSTGQGEGSLAALCSRPLAPWINADCLGMTRSSGPHRESEGETWTCVGLRERGAEGRPLRIFQRPFCRSPFPSFFLPPRAHAITPLLLITPLSFSFLFIRPFWKPSSCICASDFVGSTRSAISLITAPLPALLSACVQVHADVCAWEV